MTTGKKLALSFGVLTSITAMLAGGWWTSANKLSGLLDRAINKTEFKATRIRDIERSSLEMRLGQRGVMLYKLMNQPGRVQQAHETFRAAIRNIHQAATEIRPKIESESVRRKLDAVELAADEWTPLYEKVQLLTGIPKRSDELMATVDKTFQIAESLDNGIRELSAAQDELNVQTAAEAASAAASARWMAATLILIAFAVCGIVIRIVSGISRALREAVSDVASASHQIAGAAGQIADGSQSLAEGSTEQAAALQQTSASAEEISAMSRKNSEDAAAAIW
jgi:methyl-accepting chemotaxis protein